MSEEINQIKKVNQKIVSKTFIGIGLASAGSGAFCGFYDAMGIPFPYNHLETSLLISPVIIQSFLGILDGTNYARKGRQATGNYPYFMESDTLKLINASEETVINPEFHGGLVGAIGEGLAAGVEVAVGYGLGYLAGKIVKSFS